MQLSVINEIGKALKEAKVSTKQLGPVAAVLARHADYPITAAEIVSTYKTLVPSTELIQAAERSRTLRAALVRGEGVHVHPEILTPAERVRLVSVLQQEAKKQQLTLRTRTLGGRFYYSLSRGEPRSDWALNHPSGL